MSTTKSKVTRARKTAAHSPMDRIAEEIEALRKRVDKQAAPELKKARRGALKIALRVVDWNKTAFDNAAGAVATAQGAADKAVLAALKKTSCASATSAKSVRDWTKRLSKERASLTRTVDRAFDCATDYLERAESSLGAAKHARSAPAPQKARRVVRRAAGTAR